jgi:transposase-like protein/ssDNA-binding Zn-finger/Zn-ribbon topoisomerase 1
MNSIIHFLLLYTQYLLSQINDLLSFIAKHIPIKQSAFEDSMSPKYQKFKVDKIPIIHKFEKQDYKFLIEYYFYKYKSHLKPIKRRDGTPVPDSIKCPCCDAPRNYIYANNGKAGQFQCKVCGQCFNKQNHANKPMTLKCPYCGNTLEHKKSRLHFNIHKCVNNSCSYYKSNFNKLPKNLDPALRYKYKLRYIYREFVIDFFKMDLRQLPNWATSFKFRKNNPHIMGLSLTYHVNLGLSLRKTAHALKEVHGIDISHTMVANYAKTAAVLIKPFVDTFDYKPSNLLTADETYIKVRGLKGYVWLIADRVSRSILGYQVSDNRGVGPCILTMRMAFEKFKTFPKNALTFVADGYSAYPLAAQQFILNDMPLKITQVIGLTNDDAVSTKFRPFKQIIERLNRTFKASYRITCGYDNALGAHLGVSLWVAYYNFLRPHKLYRWKKPLNSIPILDDAGNMPAKWQLLIYMGQQVILEQQKNTS